MSIGQDSSGTPVGTTGLFTVLTRHWGAGETDQFERLEVGASDGPHGVTVSFSPNPDESTRHMWLDRTTAVSGSARRMAGLPSPFPEEEQNTALDLARELDRLTADIATETTDGPGAYAETLTGVAGLSTVLLDLRPEIDAVCERSAYDRAAGNPVSVDAARQALRGTLTEMAAEIKVLSEQFQVARELDMPEPAQEAVAPEPARRRMQIARPSPQGYQQEPVREYVVPGFSMDPTQQQS